MQKNFPAILDRIKKAGLRHEVHHFDSGAVMIDLWVNSSFYCIQIDDTTIGLSLVDEQPAFTTVPDKSYPDIQAFQTAFEKILIPAGT